MNIKIIFKSISGVMLTIITYLLGGFDNALIILIAFIGIDYISGICKAIYFKNVSSKEGLRGIIKKIGYLSLVALSTLADRIMGSEVIIRNFVIYYFVANEGISILENWGSMGLPLPKKLIKVFEMLKKESEENE